MPSYTDRCVNFDSRRANYIGKLYSDTAGPTGSSVVTPTGFSVSVWMRAGFYKQGSGFAASICSIYNSSTPANAFGIQFTVDYQTGKFIVATALSPGTSSYSTVFTMPQLNSGEWIHLLVVIEANKTQTLYINGSFINNVALNATAAAAFTDTQPGPPAVSLGLRAAIDASAYRGKASTLAMFRCPLSASDAVALYNGGPLVDLSTRAWYGGVGTPDPSPDNQWWLNAPKNLWGWWLPGNEYIGDPTVSDTERAFRVPNKAMAGVSNPDDKLSLVSLRMGLAAVQKADIPGRARNARNATPVAHSKFAYNTERGDNTAAGVLVSYGDEGRCLFDMTSGYTLNFWFKASSAAIPPIGQQFVFWSENQLASSGTDSAIPLFYATDSTYNYDVYKDPAYTLTHVACSWPAVAGAGSIKPYDDQWHMITLVDDCLDPKLYIDGVLITKTSGTYGVKASYNLYPPMRTVFNGLANYEDTSYTVGFAHRHANFAEISAFYFPLNDTEIAQLYGDGNILHAPDPSDPATYGATLAPGDWTDPSFVRRPWAWLQYYVDFDPNRLIVDTVNNRIAVRDWVYNSKLCTYDMGIDAVWLDYPHDTFANLTFLEGGALSGTARMAGLVEIKDTPVKRAMKLPNAATPTPSKLQETLEVKDAKAVRRFKLWHNMIRQKFEVHDARAFRVYPEISTIQQMLETNLLTQQFTSFARGSLKGTLEVADTVVQFTWDYADNMYLPAHTAGWSTGPARLRFTASNKEYGIVASSSYLYGDHPFTVEAWIRPVSDEIMPLFAYGYSFSTDMSSCLLALNTANCTDKAAGYISLALGDIDYLEPVHSYGPVLPAPNSWLHVVCAYESGGISDVNGQTGLRLYIDGVAVDMCLSPEITSPCNFVPSHWLIGTGLSTQFFDGDIGIIRIYDRALTADEVLLNHTAEVSEYV